MKEEEIWTTIIGFPRYEISNYGRVKSNIGKSKIMKPTLNKKGYYYINITNKYGNQKFHISRLVYAHFGTDEITEGLVVDHKDEDRSNNYIGNLQLLTQQENINKHWSFTKGWTEQQNKKIVKEKQKKLNPKNNFRSKSKLKEDLTIKISKEEYKIISKLCEKEKIKVTEFIYNAIDYYLKKDEPLVDIIKNDDWIFSPIENEVKK